MYVLSWSLVMIPHLKFSIAQFNHPVMITPHRCEQLSQLENLVLSTFDLVYLKKNHQLHKMLCRN